MCGNTTEKIWAMYTSANLSFPSFWCTPASCSNAGGSLKSKSSRTASMVCSAHAPAPLSQAFERNIRSTDIGRTYQSPLFRLIRRR